ncbi:MAG: hypothetical protein LUD22_02850 [Coprobacillus sp.]|nr:hypothetical protein [Coprobacillus sp.]
MKKSKVLTSFISVSLLLGVASCSGSSDLVIDIVDPVSLIDAAGQTNYTLRLTIDEYKSSKTVSRTDYNNEDYDLEQLKETLSWDNAYVYTVSYTENALLYDFYIEYQRSVSSHDTFIYINDYDRRYGEVMRSYYSSDGVSFKSNGLYYGSYQDYFFTLNYFIGLGYNKEEYFTKIGEGSSEDESYYIYSVDNENALRSLAYCTGLDFAYPDVSYEYDLLSFLYLYYLDQSKELEISFEEYFFETLVSTGSYYNLFNDRLTTRFYDIGLTDISDIVKQCIG